MTATREPCSIHDGDQLPGAMVAPGRDNTTIDLYWRDWSLPIEPGMAILVRGAQWLLVAVAQWQGKPAGIHATALKCNMEGTLHHITPIVTPHGVNPQNVDDVPFLGVLTLSTTTEETGTVTTTAELRPVGPWAGGPDDQITLVDGTSWAQHGDTLTESGLPLVRLRKIT